MLRKSWSPKNRARTIVVLVCVFVFLPLLGLVSSLARTSAEAAVRYYAEAIAQGRFEDALSVEMDRGRNDSRVTWGSLVDLRRAQVAAPSSVSAVRMYSGRDVWGRQGAAIDFSVNGRTVTREIYVENTASLRLHVGPWRIAEGAAREETVRTEGYATEVTVGGSRWALSEAPRLAFLFPRATTCGIPITMTTRYTRTRACMSSA